jgi:hypothetical protein
MINKQQIYDLINNGTRLSEIYKKMITNIREEFKCNEFPFDKILYDMRIILTIQHKCELERNYNYVPEIIMVDPREELTLFNDFKNCSRSNSRGCKHVDNDSSFKIINEDDEYNMYTLFDDIYWKDHINKTMNLDVEQIHLKFWNIEKDIIGISSNFLYEQGELRMLLKINPISEIFPFPWDIHGNFLYLPGSNHCIYEKNGENYCSSMRYFIYYYGFRENKYKYMITLINYNPEINDYLDELLKFESRNRILLDLINTPKCRYLNRHEITIDNIIEISEQKINNRLDNCGFKKREFGKRK